jgi:hypothetical protein
MKKSTTRKIGFIAILTIVLSFVSTGLIGCQKPKIIDKGNNALKFNIDYIASYMANIEDATALGIVKGTTTQTAAKTSTTAKTKATGQGKVAYAAEENTKNYLVKQTVEKASQYVDFKKTTEEPVYDGEGNLIGTELKQESLPAQVNKVYLHPVVISTV